MKPVSIFPPRTFRAWADLRDIIEMPTNWHNGRRQAINMQAFLRRYWGMRYEFVRVVRTRVHSATYGRQWRIEVYVSGLMPVEQESVK